MAIRVAACILVADLWLERPARFGPKDRADIRLAIQGPAARDSALPTRLRAVELEDSQCSSRPPARRETMVMELAVHPRAFLAALLVAFVCRLLLDTK